MSYPVKTIVATGLTSGLGFEALKQLLAERAHRYRLVLGARDVSAFGAALEGVLYDRAQHAVQLLPLDLADLESVRAFAHAVPAGALEFLLLNAGMSKDASAPAGPRGSRWCETHVVNHLSQHYLIHLLRARLEASHARLIFVSSGAIQMVSDPSTLRATLAAGSDASVMAVYAASKFVQLLGAHWWRRELGTACTVLAVSPGLIPGTGLARHSDHKLPTDHPDAKSVAEGGENILRPMYRDDFPEDTDRIFFTSWGEWWTRDKIEKTCDKTLQDQWCPSLEEIERDEKLI